MKLIVDSNVLIDIFINDPVFEKWSYDTLAQQLSLNRQLCINPIIYSELSLNFKTCESLNTVLQAAHIEKLALSDEALFIAAQAFVAYKKNNGGKQNVLPDFFIGAHAQDLRVKIVTRDTARFKTYFPSISLITP